MIGKENEILDTLKLLDSMAEYKCQILSDTLSFVSQYNVYKEQSEFKPPYQLNFLEELYVTEPITSWMIRHILAYSFEGRYPFLESFVSRFLRAVSFDPAWIDSPVIIKEHEYKNIDILVRDKNYAIIIENKLKDAEFQMNQLARYIETMHQEGYKDNQIFLVILPQRAIRIDDIPLSVWRLPFDWKRPKAERKCRKGDNLCWCDFGDVEKENHCSLCVKSIRSKNLPEPIIIQKEFAEWLYDCVMNNAIDIPKQELQKQFVLCSAVLQLADYCNGLYETRESDKYMADIQAFLKKQLQLDKEPNKESQYNVVAAKLKEVEDLEEKLGSLRIFLYHQIIDEMIATERIAGDYDGECDFVFRFSCDNVDCRLVISEDNRGYFCQLDTINRNVPIPQTISGDSVISKELVDNDKKQTAIWSYDNHIASTHRFERVYQRIKEII